MNDMTAAPAVELRGLTKSYGPKQVLTGLDLTVAPGIVLALLGPNGAGKTTTVEILQGLLRPDAGEVRVLGEEPRRAGRAWRARLGVVSQSSHDLVDLTVTEAVAPSARFYAEPTDVAATIARVGLADDARTRAGRLSGRRRRRLGGRLAEDGTVTELARSAGSECLVSWLEGRTPRSTRTTRPTALVAELTDRLARADGEVPGLEGRPPGLEGRPPSLEDHYLALVADHEATGRPQGDAA